MFVNELVPEMHALGLSLPDPDLHFDQASGNWIFDEIDWDEFWQVVKGDGPCNAGRLGARPKALRRGMGS